MVFVGYRTVNEPRRNFTLRFAPDPGTPLVQLGELGAGTGTYATLEDQDFDTAQNVLTLTDALYPGQQLDVSYRVSPPLRDCFTLSGKAAKDYTYAITYGALDDSAAPVALADTDFTMTDDDHPKLCLAAPLVKHGFLVSVTYLKEKAHTETDVAGD